MNIALEDKIVRLMAKTLKKESSNLKITAIAGGFTGASKYLLDGAKKKLFLKVADSKTHDVDAQLVEFEAKIYRLLANLGLTERLFPNYENFVDEDGVKILVIDYLGDVSWSAPWNEASIKKLDVALKKLHSTRVSATNFAEIEKISGEVLSVLGQELHPKKISDEEIVKKNKPFFDAWSLEKGGFVNSIGELYFASSNSLADEIFEEAQKGLGEKKKVLIMHDLNFANICFSKKQAYFVDPLFLRMGYADSDRTLIGMNILEQAGISINQGFRSMIINKYITNKIVLAKLIKYYVTATAEKLNKSQESWQKFHQNCAVTALKLFQDWNLDR